MSWKEIIKYKFPDPQYNGPGLEVASILEAGGPDLLAQKLEDPSLSLSPEARRITDELLDRDTVRGGLDIFVFNGMAGDGEGNPISTAQYSSYLDYQEDVKTGYRRCPNCFSACVQETFTLVKCTHPKCGWKDLPFHCVTEGEWCWDGYDE